MAKSKKDKTPAKPEGEKKEKKSKPEFKLVNNKNKEIYPFAVAMPDGYEMFKMVALKKKDFTADHLFLEFRALEMDARAIDFRAKAEEAKKLGNAADRGKAKRLIKMTDKMAELRAKLEEQGIDVDAMLASAAAKKE